MAKYPFVGTLPEILGQALSLTAMKNSIERLRAKAWLDQEGPVYLSWSRPPTSHWGLATFAESPLYMDMVKDEVVVLPIWMAEKSEGKVTLTLNTEAKTKKLLSELTRPFVDIDIQFIPIETKPRQFRLNVKSWDELNLTERS